MKVTKLLGSRLLVRPLKRKKEEEKTVGGIILLETTREDKREGEVIAVGEGDMLGDGFVVPMEIKVGDGVFWDKIQPTTIEVEGEKLFIIPENKILAIIKQGQK